MAVILRVLLRNISIKTAPYLLYLKESKTGIQTKLDKYLFICNLSCSNTKNMKQQTLLSLVLLKSMKMQFHFSASE